jgi:hypothetical protein
MFSRRDIGISYCDFHFTKLFIRYYSTRYANPNIRGIVFAENSKFHSHFPIHTRDSITRISEISALIASSAVSTPGSSALIGNLLASITVEESNHFDASTWEGEYLSSLRQCVYCFPAPKWISGFSFPEVVLAIYLQYGCIIIGADIKIMTSDGSNLENMMILNPVWWRVEEERAMYVIAESQAIVTSILTQKIDVRSVIKDYRQFTAHTIDPPLWSPVSVSRSLHSASYFNLDSAHHDPPMSVYGKRELNRSLSIHTENLIDIPHSDSVEMDFVTDIDEETIRSVGQAHNHFGYTRFGDIDADVDAVPFPSTASFADVRCEGEGSSFPCFPVQEEEISIPSLLECILNNDVTPWAKDYVFCSPRKKNEVYFQIVSYFYFSYFIFH